MKTTLAIVSDLHDGDRPPGGARRGDLADILLLRTVHRLNRYIHPDVVLIPGDLLNDGTAADAHERLIRLRGILDKLTCPWLAIPGNHDGDPEAFFRVFRRPGDWEDLAGIRFLPFIDPDEPGYNARRQPADVGRFRAARSGWTGPIVAFQHVCLVPPGTSNLPYNYTNAGAIVAAMREAGVVLSVSGHFHAAAPDVQADGTTFVTVPALCEKPFPFTLVTLDDGRVSTERPTLAMPEHLGLTDGHVHTSLAYCSENMTVERAIDLAADFGLAGIGFAEHSGQLYFSREDYWSGRCFREGLSGSRPDDYRMAAYWDLRRRYGDSRILFGLEVDAGRDGQPVLAPGDRARADFLMGAIHDLPCANLPEASLDDIRRAFLALLEPLLASGIQVLAHPFRIFRRHRREPPADLFVPTAQRLRRYGVAAEINFHTNEPSVEFVRVCLAEGVKLSLGSDSHNLYEVGEFAPHLRLLKEAGFDGALDDILIRRKRNGTHPGG